MSGPSDYVKQGSIGFRTRGAFPFRRLGEISGLREGCKGASTRRRAIENARLRDDVQSRGGSLRHLWQPRPDDDGRMHAGSSHSARNPTLNRREIERTLHDFSRNI